MTGINAPTRLVAVTFLVLATACTTRGPRQTRLMDDAFTREVNKLFARGLALAAIVLGGFATITFLGVRALKRQSGSTQYC